MKTYSLKFLETEWDGKGYDFGLHCVFYDCGFDNDKISRFLTTLSESFPFSNLSKHTFTTDDIKVLTLQDIRNDLASLDSYRILHVEFESNKFSGYLDLMPKNHMVISAESDLFFSGNESLDRDFILELLNIARIGISCFGPASVAFGVLSVAMDQAIRQAADVGGLLSSNSSVEILLSQIQNSCYELMR